MTRLADVADKDPVKERGAVLADRRYLSAASAEAYAQDQRSASAARRVARRCFRSMQACDAQAVRSWPILHVVKFSLPRPNIQGTAADRDMHGASFANLLADIEV